MASHPGQIPAGGKDNIKVLVHTDEKGGQTITKRFRVTTNDPQANMTVLEVTGKIEALIDLSSSWVRIAGFKGDDLSKEVRITPHKDYPFTIKEVKSRFGSQKIRWKLKPLGTESPDKGYILKVICDDKGEGRPGDIIDLETDLKEKPKLKIQVSCKFFDKPQKNKEQVAK